MTVFQGATGQPPRGEVISPAVGALSIQHVSKAHHVTGRHLDVLRDINLDIAPGEFVSILGQRLIIGLYNDYHGEIRLDGARILSTSLDRGIVFQDHRLFPWRTVEQNIAVALSKRDLHRATKAQLVAQNIASVGLDGFEGASPHQFSGGMAQRAAIARASVNAPKVLLLDEPFGALDALTLQQDLPALRQRTQCTVVMVTHNVQEAIFLGDRVVVMRGRPGAITRILPVQLATRERKSRAFAALEEAVLAELTVTPDETQVSRIDAARRQRE